MNHKQAIGVLKYDTTNPKAIEEQIGQILYAHSKDETGTDVIKIFQNNGSEDETREYFLCDNFDYITQTIVPLILDIF